MQLSLFTFVIIVSLLTSIVLTEFQEKYKEIKISMNDPIDRMNLDESAHLKSSSSEMKSNIENLPNTREKRKVSQIRNGRTTYVKAILSNPKISPSQQLAEKLARNELKSPKMQETFKKLSAIHTPSQNFRDKSGNSKISTFVRSPKILEDSNKLSSFKGPRKRKRKRHKKRERNDSRRGQNLARRKINNSHSRLTRQTANFLGKNDERRPKDHYEKSFGDNPDESLENFDNNQNLSGPQKNSNLGLNYPGVEAPVDTNFQNFGSDENNSLNYGSNYPPNDDQSDNLEISNSMSDNNRDFSLSNDQSAVNRFSSLEDNSKIQYNENNPNPQDNQERQDPLQSRNYGLSNPNQAWIDQNAISSKQNVQNRFEGRPIDPNKNIQGPFRYNGRGNNFRNNYDNNFERNFSPLNSKFRSGSINSINGQSSNHITKIQSDVEKNFRPEVILSTNFVNPTQSPFDYSRPMKSPRVEKSEQSIEKMISGYVKSRSSTEMNPKLEGIGEASAVPPEMIEKTIDESKSLKGMEYHLLPSVTLPPQAAVAKSQKNFENNTALATETKEVAGQILNKIIEELEELKLDRNKNEQKEGLPCKLSGSWITTQAGVRIDMLVTNRSVNVSMAKLDLPVGVVRQSLLNYTWNLTGHAPFKRGGPFSLIATDNHTKSLAVFVGACRICQGVDTIEGVWSIAREPRDCRDFQMATSIYNDIFRRTNLLSAIKEKQSIMMMDTLKFTDATDVTISKEEYSSTSPVNGKVS